MPWPKGKPRPPGAGRQAGTPNKVTVEVREWAQAILSDPQGQAQLLAQYRRGELSDTKLTLLMHYAYGKPKEQIELAGADNMPLQIVFTRRIGSATPTPQDAP